MERFRELASKASRGPAPAEKPLASSEPEFNDASSFRRLLRSEPAKVVPGTYEESTVYFAQKRPSNSTNRRKQDEHAENINSRSAVAPAERNFASIIPEHLLAPAKAIEPQSITPRREETPDLFGEEDKSVRWHEDVMGGSFSTGSSDLIERPEPVTPKQESSHRLLENEIIIEPFRTHAGELKDGSEMPLVVPREWTNRYWAALTELAYPGTDLKLRIQRPMTSLHPKESPELAMERRRRILKSFPRNEKHHLILSEHDSVIIDTFEENLRREIVGPKRVPGETRRMWGFSRNQIKEALVVLKVSRQRRIQWLTSAGESLEDWGLA
ncbi:hypothetical protein ABW20_dc0110670 [Dactylellina cionopaga]|nr:hypothetical protein ABW20_dc0110670 [Dactylellina cionopaga]